MWTITALRAHPHFAPLFAHVHALCWPILWWQLNRLIGWFQAAGSPNVLYSVTRWGFVSVRVIGDKPDPTAYKPLERTFRSLTDPNWGSDMPHDLPACAFSEDIRAALFLPRLGGGGGSRHRRETEGALGSRVLDST